MCEQRVILIRRITTLSNKGAPRARRPKEPSHGGTFIRIVDPSGIGDHLHLFPLGAVTPCAITAPALTAAANMQLPHGARFAPSSSGWYHDEAIRANDGRDH